MPYGSEALWRQQFVDENGIVGSIKPLRTPQLDATPFDLWKRSNAADAIVQTIPQIHARAVRMLDGDMWQGGWGWIGPHPDPLNDSADAAQQMWLEIGCGFVSRNGIREITRRFKRAVVGREPRWALVPRDSSVLEPVTPPQQQTPPPPTNPLADANAPSRAERRRVARASGKKKVPDALQQLIDEASRALTLWWDERGVKELFEDVVVDLQMPAGRSGLRLYIPDGFTTVVATPDITGGARGTRSTRVSSASSLDDALAKLYPEHPNATTSLLYEDRATKRRVSIVVSRIADAANSTGREVIELSYLDADGVKTKVRTIDGEADTSSTTTQIDLGGRLLMHEVKMDPIITEQMIQLQRALNLALTMLPRNITTSGFMNRIIANAKLPGYWEVDENKKRTGKYIVTDFPTFGPGHVNFMTGEETKNKDGTSNLAPVTIHETPPVDPTPTLTGISGLYEAMLAEGEQDHILQRSTGNANTGRSQEQSRSGFEHANEEIASRVNALGRWLMETALAGAEVLMGKPGRYTSQLRCVFECRTRTGPVNAADRASWITAFEKGAVSKETAQEAIGILDVDAENDKIEKQDGGAIDTVTRQANAFKMLVDATLGGDVAGEIVGFSDDLIERISESFAEQQQIKVQQQQAQLETQQAIAQTRANAQGDIVGQQNGPGRPSGNRAPRKRQGLSKTTQKQIEPNRARPTPPQQQ